MPSLKIRFVSSNPFKLKEATAILSAVDVEVVPLNLKVNELQSEITHELVRDKTLKAFEKVGRPLFVEHTGLYLNYLNQLPGGLTQVFWDRLQADRFAELFGRVADVRVVAKTVIGFTDARSFHTFEGVVAGQVASSPRGNRDFQWDCIFVPDGYEQTFAELGDKKNEISMRRIALDRFAEFLKSAGIRGAH